jgi:cation diffusion facilitator family transporter
MNSYKLFVAIVIIYMIVELIVGIISNSIALQTDAFHMLSDMIALIVAGLSKHFSDTGTSNIRYSYGLKRSEILGGFFNSCFLLTNLFWLARENVSKFIELSNNNQNDELQNNLHIVLPVAIGGALVNIIGIKLFHGNSNSNSHEHNHNHSHNSIALLLHLITDLLGSIVVIISSSVILATDWNYRFFLDPLGSSIIIVLLTPQTIKSIINSGKLLMHKSPKEIDIESLKKDIESVPGIIDVHELHVWCIDSNINIASMHIKCLNSRGIVSKVKDILHSYNIHSSSIQKERGDCPEPICKINCENKKCCSKSSAIAI